MKLIYSLGAAALAALLLPLQACEDLDTAPEGSTVTADQKSDIHNSLPARAQASVDGMFLAMSRLFGIASVHADFGYGTIMLMTDSNGEDMVSSDVSYNHFRASLNWLDRPVTTNAVRYVWNNLYSYIFNANGLLVSIDPQTTQPDLLFSRGQALALRGFSYFQLAQLLQFNIVGHEEAPCVPIVTEANTTEYGVDGGRRATVRQVYGQVRADLDEAIRSLSRAAEAGVGRNGKNQVSLGVAYGLRARVNLVARQWAEAAADAQAAIAASKDLAPASIADLSAPTFVDIGEANWMWGIDINETDDVATGLVNFPSHICSLSYGYTIMRNSMRISLKLFATIPETDVRRGQWLVEGQRAFHLTADGDTVDHLTTAMRDYAASRNYSATVNVKFGPYNGVVGTSTKASDIPLMRIEEMYLILAEAQLKGGNEGLARTTLTNFVKTYRDPAYAVPVGRDLHQEIWRQRRVEFWGEGISWFDIMRLGMGIDRRNAGFEDTRVYRFEGTDTRLLWQIPQSEINNNNALTTADYNPIAPDPVAVADNATASIWDETIPF